MSSPGVNTGRSRGSRITGWASALPDRIVTNHELAETLDTSDEWIVERTGISQRRIGGTTHSLSVESGKAAIARAGLSSADIDMVVLATTTPDKRCPATASTVQDSLGITGGAFDVNAACSGFVYGLAVGDGLIATGANNVLVIGTDTLHQITDTQDRSTAILFADGSGSMVLSAVEGSRQYSFVVARIRRIARATALCRPWRLPDDDRQRGVPQRGQLHGRNKS